MQPKRLAILGVGLLGGSIGLSVRSILNNCQIIGYGHRASTIESAISIGAIDEGWDDPAKAVTECDLVILCTPVGIFADLLRKIAPSLGEGAIVTDVGSTKRSVVAAAQQLLPASAHFVGSHPMAGSEKRGVEFARADLFRHAICITTPTPQTDPAALEKVESFWKSLAMRLTRLSPDDHDRLLADISHLPHALAAALILMQSEGSKELAGKGFLDATRIASGDAGLWRDIFLDNADNLRDSLARVKALLEELDGLLDPKRRDALRAWLNAATTARDDLLSKKLREMNPD